MTPCQAGRVEPVEVVLCHQPLGHELVVLLGARNRAEDVEGSERRAQLTQHLQVPVYILLRVLREADDVREVGADPMLAA